MSAKYESCGYAMYGPPALCTCGECVVDQAEMDAANEELGAWVKTLKKKIERTADYLESLPVKTRTQ